MCAGATLGHCKIKFTFITILYKYTDFGKYSSYLCTGGAYYVTYRFRFISNKSWDGGGRGGSLSLNRPIVRRGELRRGWVILLNSPVWWIK